MSSWPGATAPRIANRLRFTAESSRCGSAMCERFDDGLAFDNRGRRVDELPPLCMLMGMKNRGIARVVSCAGNAAADMLTTGMRLAIYVGTRGGWCTRLPTRRLPAAHGVEI